MHYRVPCGPRGQGTPFYLLAVWAVGITAWPVTLLAQLPPDCLPPAQAREALERRASAEVFNAVGAYFAQRSEARCAVAAFREAVRLEPRGVESQFNLGLALIRQGDLAAAADHLRNLSRSAPDFFPGRMAYGTALAESGAHESAAAEFLAAQELDPRSVEAAQALDRKSVV